MDHRVPGRVVGPLVAGLVAVRLLVRLEVQKGRPVLAPLAVGLPLRAVTGVPPLVLAVGGQPWLQLRLLLGRVVLLVLLRVLDALHRAVLGPLLLVPKGAAAVRLGGRVPGLTADPLQVLSEPLVRRHVAAVPLLTLLEPVLAQVPPPRRQQLVFGPRALGQVLPPPVDEPQRGPPVERAAVPPVVQVRDPLEQVLLALLPDKVRRTPLPLRPGATEVGFGAGQRPPRRRMKVVRAVHQQPFVSPWEPAPPVPPLPLVA